MLAEDGHESYCKVNVKRSGLNYFIFALEGSVNPVFHSSDQKKLVE